MWSGFPGGLQKYHPPVSDQTEGQVQKTQKHKNFVATVSKNSAATGLHTPGCCVLMFRPVPYCGTYMLSYKYLMIYVICDILSTSCVSSRAGATFWFLSRARLRAGACRKAAARRDSSLNKNHYLSPKCAMYLRYLI